MREQRRGRMLRRRTGGRSGNEGRGRFTVMVIPHSEKRIVNLRVTAVVFAFLGVLLFGFVSLFFYVSTVYSGRGREVAQRSRELEQTQRGLEEVREQITGLRGGAAEFEASIQRALQAVRLDSSTEDSAPADTGVGDFEEMGRFREASPEDVPDSLFVASVGALLDQYAGPLGRLSEVFEEERDFLTNLPVLWPIDSGAGRVSRRWGPSEDPIRGDFDMHQGVLIWDVPGSPVVASANGQITQVDFDPDGYGWFVDIDHNFGFTTRYAHLQQVRVRSGEQVSQGQTIGTLGSTGRTVKPALGFEVWLGTENVDPDVFLTVRSPFAGSNGQFRPIDPLFD